MKSELLRAVLLGSVLGVLHGVSVKAGNVVPNFTRGTVTSDTTSTTTVVETIHQIEYTTGTSYSVTGTNINVPANPGPDANYTSATPGQPFQFAETVLGPGISSETWIDRTTTINSTTNSLSVFTQ